MDVDITIPVDGAYDWAWENLPWECGLFLFLLILIISIWLITSKTDGKNICAAISASTSITGIGFFAWATYPKNTFDLADYFFPVFTLILLISIIFLVITGFLGFKGGSKLPKELSVIFKFKK